MITINMKPTQVIKSYEGKYVDDNSGEEYTFYIKDTMSEIYVEWHYGESHGEEIDNMIILQFVNSI